MIGAWEPGPPIRVRGFVTGSNHRTGGTITDMVGTEGDTAVPAPVGSVPADPATTPWHPGGTGPVPMAAGPVRRRPRKVLGRTLGKAWGDSLFGFSSQAAFWCALSTPPFLLALLGLVGYVAPWFGPGTMTDVRTQITAFLHTIFNREVADTLVGNTVDTILNNGQAGVVSVGLLISLWAGSSATSAFIESITIAYVQHEVRHPAVERLFALGLYLIALTAGILLVPLLAIGPDALPGLFPVTLRPSVTSIVGYAYYPGLILGLLLLLTTLYKVAPKHKHAWKRGLPGALLAAVFFVVASGGLRLYLAYVYSHGLTYGALATPITFRTGRIGTDARRPNPGRDPGRTPGEQRSDGGCGARLRCGVSGVRSERSSHRSSFAEGRCRRRPGPYPQMTG